MGNITNAKGYVRGEKAAAAETSREPVPIKAYLGVFGALLVLTAITVLLSEVDLGSASFVIAMGVAVVQAALLVGFFMHLKYDARFHSFVFFGALFFAALFLLFPCIDGDTRDAVNATWGNDQLIEDKGLDARPDPIPGPQGEGEIKVEGEPEAD